MKNKIAIVTRENVVGNVTLNKLIPDMVDMGFEPVVFITDNPEIKGACTALMEMSHMETGLYRDVVAPYLNYNPMMADGQALDGVNYTIDQLADLHGVDIYELDDVNSQDFIEHVANDNDIVGGVNVRGLSIFKEEIIDTFNNKEDGFFWNLHPGNLPQYKGLYIPFRAAQNQEKTVGQTLHRINKGIDQGAMIAIQAIVFDPQKPVLETYLDLAPIGADLILVGLDHYKRHGAPIGVSQTNEEKQSYYPLPSADEINTLADQGTIFATPDDVERLFIDLYSRADTPHAQGLKTAIRDALNPQNAQTSEFSPA